MTPEKQLFNRNLSLLQLASKIENVSEACNMFGVSRQHYYNLKNKVTLRGTDGLNAKIRQPPNMPNQTPPNIELKIIDYALENPGFGKDRVAYDMRWKGIWISPSGVGKIFKRNKMENASQRVNLLQKKLELSGFGLNPDQVQTLAEHSSKLKNQHVISHFPGYLLCQDTYYVGNIKGIGKIFMQSVVDTFGSFGFAKLYTSKESITSADILVKNVLPFYDSMNVPVLNLLTDNGREYCGNMETHYFQKVLKLFSIQHRRTRPGTPKTNGFVERFHQTVFREFFYSQFHKKWYYEVEPLQHDLDKWLYHYNFRRTHQGYRCNGKTPSDIFNSKKYLQKLLTMRN